MSVLDNDEAWYKHLAEVAARCESEEREVEQAERADPARVLERQRDEHRRKLEAVAAELRAMGVPELTVEPFLRGKVLETSAITRVRSWRRTRSWVLVIMGPGGIGKDVSMAWHPAQSARQRVEAGRPAPHAQRSWFSAYDLMALGDYRKTAELERVESMPELFIEDLGTESPRLDLLFNILNKRYQSRLRTVATTNLNAADFQAYAGKRIVDRINANGVFCGVTGPNLRELGVTGDHGLSAEGHVEAQRHHSEPEERERRFVQPRAEYRLRMPKAKATRQLKFPFAMAVPHAW